MSLLKQPAWLRGLEISSGLLALILSFVVFAFPGLGVATLVVVLSVGLIFVGIRSLSTAGYKRLSKGNRALSVASGIIALIFAATVILLPGYGLLSLIVILSFGLMLYGVSRISLAYSLKATSRGLRVGIAMVGVLDIIVSAGVIALPGVALLTLAVLLGVALLFAGAEMIISGAVGRTWLGEAKKAMGDLKTA